MGTVSSVNWAPEIARQGGSKRRNAGRSDAAEATGHGRDFDYELLPCSCATKGRGGADRADPRHRLRHDHAELGQFAPAFLWLATIFISEGILLALCAHDSSKQPRETVDLNQWRGTLPQASSSMACAGRRSPSPNSIAANASRLFLPVRGFDVVTAIRMLFAASVMPILHAGTSPVTGAFACGSS